MGLSTAAKITTRAILAGETQLSMGLPLQKKMAVSFTNGFFNVPAGMTCRGLSYKTDTGGKAINLLLAWEDSADVIDFEKNLIYPLEVNQIVESRTTAANIFIWG